MTGSSCLITRRGAQVDRKINLLVGELRHFDINIAGISETKWFSEGVYEVDGFVLVHSGRPVPADSELVQRNERGVGTLVHLVQRNERGVGTLVHFSVPAHHLPAQVCQNDQKSSMKFQR